MTEFELFNALRPFYPPREYALLPQTANATGFSANRHCDALALSLWPSRGHTVSGFEIKRFRGDWLREKKDPEKGDDIGKFCNYWWIVTAGPNIAPVDELPLPWGLKVWDQESGKLKIVKKAVYWADAVPLNIGMIAAILRKAQDVVTPDALIAAARKEGYDEGLKTGELSAARDTSQLRELQNRLRIIQKKSGVKLDTWQPAEDVGDALKVILDGTQQEFVSQLRRVATKIALEFGIEEQCLDEESAYKLREIRSGLKGARR